jgi:metal-sulfur cluster biosynthetic enzyme
MTAVETAIPDLTALQDQVWDRLDLVMDPELDEPITDMGFVEAVVVGPGGIVEVNFRLPTYWCSPNFAFLMARDIRREVRVLPWVTDALVRIQDHMAAEEMSAAVNADKPFCEVFPELAKGDDLAALRETFDQKAFQRRQEVVIKGLLAQGLAVEKVIGLRLGDLQAIGFADPEAARHCERYLTLLIGKGIAATAADLALPTYQRRALTMEGFADYMALLRSVRINMEFSGSLCRGLKRSRYKELVPGEDGLTLVDVLPPPGPAPHQDPITQAKHCG